MISEEEGMREGEEEPQAESLVAGDNRGLGLNLGFRLGLGPDGQARAEREWLCARGLERDQLEREWVRIMGDEQPLDINQLEEHRRLERQRSEQHYPWILDETWRRDMEVDQFETDEETDEKTDEETGEELETDEEREE